MILVKVRVKRERGGEDRGWWQFVALPREGDIISLGEDPEAGYRVTAVIYNPVEQDKVSEYRPPYATVVIELLMTPGLSNT